MPPKPGRGKGKGKGAGRGAGRGRAAGRGVSQLTPGIKKAPAGIKKAPKKKTLVQQKPSGVPRKAPPMAGRHTILLMQPTGAKTSRSWHDYQSPSEALDSFVSMYEKQLKELNPTVPTISYSAADLHTYIDQLADLSVLMLDPATKQYAPHGKEYVKQQLLTHLKKLAK